MKRSRLNNMIAGIVIICAGFGLLLNNLGLISFGLSDMLPLVIVYMGLRLWAKQRRILGGFVTGLGALITLHAWFGVGVDDVFGVMVALGLIYFGFRLVRSRRETLPTTQAYGGAEMVSAAEPSGANGAGESSPPPPMYNMRIESAMGDGQSYPPRESRSALIGDFHLTSGRFELRHLHIWHGIGDVVIDLSRALIPEEETSLVINGWVGDVTVYVPVDLPVAVAAEVTIGDMDVFGHRQGGMNRRIVMTADRYAESARKVKIIVSLIVGDIDVKYV